ncbi:MAG: hypothetical protein HN392_03020 [Anaerolineae bacterium]|jgi:hypothetical protein|nr:hypothetical protein [Anaerolineae bacterium]MBT7075415.1 hypothetical protein [Anaerolineae bacterium]MBT7782940.1 hypothetical protein [Anaerolineae bacterium]
MDLITMLRKKFQNPILAAIVALVLGFGLGLFWGYQVDPVIWYDTAPELLSEGHQVEYLRMTIDSFTANSDTALAMQRWENLGPKAQERLAQISNAPGAQNKAAIDAFGMLMGAALPVTTPESEATESGGLSPTLQYLFIGLGLLVVAVVGFFAYKLLRPTVSPGGEETPAQQAAKIAQSTEQTDYSDMGLATPITQSMTSYVGGDDLYDESFSIESQAGEFMGEYGVGISDTIGVGDPKKVTALEIWLFDKNDIKTATKVLMSEHAYNDPTIRQRLEAKGELVVIGAQKQIKLETETLQLLVTVADLEYGSAQLPPSSYFDRATLELAIWPKTDG